jgi:O-antigen ligase
MQTPNALQIWISQLDRRWYAALIGLLLGLVGGSVALLLVVAGPTLTIAAVLGVLVALYILTDVNIALYGAVGTLLLLPFGTFPVDIGLTPTLLDMALGAFVLVYLFEWMTGKRQRLSLTPIHALIALYTMWLILAFMLGLRYGNPTSTIIRQFAEMLLSISMTVVLVDMLRQPQILRRLVLVIMIFIGAQAVLAIFLWALPDVTAESLLVRLSAIGYPNGGVIRYIEANPELGERAIGTWVDPNALGGILAVGAALIAPQIFAQRPVLRYRWVTFGVFGLTVFALFLSSSRASFLALASALFVIAVIRYRRFLPLLGVGGVLLLLLPQTQNYVDRLLQAFQGADLATQMRIGEWTDSLNLIRTYPLTGIGFTGTPTADVYTDVANMYLIMGNQIGVTGVVLFLIAMVGVFAYGWRAWRYAKGDAELDSIHLGYHVALLAALVNAFADLYYFRLDFQSSITWFWLTVSLSLASSHLVLQKYVQSPTIKTTRTDNDYD